MYKACVRVISLWICVASANLANRSKYCIIGAGPAGVQLGLFMTRAELDFVTFDRGDHAGWWFSHYPVHRKLISINRRQTRSSNSEFNLRHDWNSLLDSDIPMFTNWTEDYFPDADVLVDYLRAVAWEQRDQIKFRHEVTRVERIVIDGQTMLNLTLRLGEDGLQAAAWTCDVVIAASGLWYPNVPRNWIRGLRNTVGYEELSPWPGGAAFKDKSVLILGGGNGAFETADAVRNYASDIGILSRSEARFAHESRYVGHVRAHRLTSMDSLQLKSLDDVFVLPQNQAVRLEFLPCASPASGQGQGGQGWPQGVHDTELSGFMGLPPVCTLSDYNKEEFLIADHDPENPAVAKALLQWPDFLVVRNASAVFVQWHKRVLRDYGEIVLNATDDAIRNNLQGDSTVLTINKKVARQLVQNSSEFRAALPDLMASTQGLWLAHDRLRKPFDVVVRALGWKADFGPLDPMEIRVDTNGKYPEVDACFMSQDGLYFAGSITHGFDKFRFGSAGGFIHGFRYTTRSLFRCLLEKYEGGVFWHGARYNYSWTPGIVSSAETLKSPWKIRIELDKTQRWAHLLRRINEASGPYQMSCGALVDGIVYHAEPFYAEYFEDVPLDLFEQRFSAFPRLMLQFRYGTREDINHANVLRSRLVAFASRFLHPVLFFMLPGRTVENSVRLHLVEDRWTDFAGREEVLSLWNFLLQIETASVPGAAEPKSFHEVLDSLELDCNHHRHHS